MTYNLTGSIQWSSSQAQQLFGIILNQYREDVFTHDWVIIRYGSQPYYAILYDYLGDHSEYLEVRMYTTYQTTTIEQHVYQGDFTVSANGYMYVTGSMSFVDGSMPIDFFNGLYTTSTYTLVDNQFSFIQFSEGLISIALLTTLIISAISLFLRRLF